MLLIFKCVIKFELCFTNTKITKTNDEMINLNLNSKHEKENQDKNTKAKV